MLSDTSHPQGMTHTENAYEYQDAIIMNTNDRKTLIIKAKQMQVYIKVGFNRMNELCTMVLTLPPSDGNKRWHQQKTITTLTILSNSKQQQSQQFTTESSDQIKLFN
jgi:hypothetical protein